ncbi:hypothetical protein PTTG_06205 [Puccinia triticina 1-1 BBBD Race 1]|uniref:Uncharacterized protein n=2 Tax=Puccinia triticina TaxID=208348 RepID=A0A180GBT7_PUCT1|nr:uncharacterized protein PtA15_7A475 [Puccinia triticina]OAV90147.1 hypothetical protein PTTG_06205 [Puccinia triticina 1-1 BBBD Race 1]WAQ86747.1 hypothetical protein PtA15_7A475 [Puccinia triticina]
MLPQILLVSTWLTSFPGGGAINRAVPVEQSNRPLRALTLPRMTTRQSRGLEYSYMDTSSISEIEANGSVGAVDGMNEVLVSDQMAKESTPVTAMPPHKRAEMKENWRKNQGHVISLFNESSELLSIHSEIRSQLAWMKENNQVQNSDFFKVVDLVKKAQETMSIFKQIKLLELGKADFKIINCFLDQDAVREIFQEDKLVEQIIFYASERFESEIKEDIWVSFTSLTDHWYWAQLNDCFKGKYSSSDILALILP